MEQAEAPQVQEAAPAFEAPSVPSTSEVQAARSTSTDTAQNTIDESFGTPMLFDSQGSEAAQSISPEAGTHSAAGGVDGTASDGNQTPYDGNPNPADGGQSGGGSGGGGRDNGSKDLDPNGRNKDGILETEPTAKAGSEEAAVDVQSKPPMADQTMEHGGAMMQGSREILSADKIVDAGYRGKLGETLKAEGVDIENQKELDEYLGASFDANTELGLRLNGLNLPENPTDADFGNALAPHVDRSDMTADMKEKFKADPEAGYKAMRQMFLDMQHQGLAQEKAEGR